MSTARFTEQDELQRIYDAYLAVTASAKMGPTFNKLAIATANDGAGVIFSADSVLFDTEYSRSAQGSIAKQISERLIACIAYYLVKKVPAEDVPSTMRLCMSVCHNNSHWTGLVVELANFREIYQSFEQHCRDYKLTFNDDNTSDENVIHNRAKNAVLHKIGAVDEYNNKIADEDIKTKFFFKALKTHKDAQVVINHFDSLNANSYHQGISESIEMVTKEDPDQIELIPHACGYQVLGSNTCGDHTVFNIFSFAHLNAIPSINDDKKDSLVSQDLRNFTDLVAKSSPDHSSITEQAKRLLKTVSANFNDSTDKPKRGKYAVIESTTAELVVEIHASTKLFTPTLIHTLSTDPLLQTDDLIKMIEEFNATQVNPANKIVYDNRLIAKIKSLRELFLGNHQFTQFNVKAENVIEFGALAYSAAANLCSEIEHEQLRSTQTDSALLKQEIALDEYSKRSSSPDSDTFDTACKKSPNSTSREHSPTLFGEYRSAATTPTSNSDTEIDLDTLLSDLEQKTHPKPVTGNLYAGKIAGTVLGILIGAAIGVASFLLAPLTLGGSLIIGGALIIGLATLGGGVLGFGIGLGIDRWRRSKGVVAPTTSSSKNGSTTMVYDKRKDGTDLLPRPSQDKHAALEYPPRVDAKQKTEPGESHQSERNNKPKI